jgi:hypothetical protein
MKRELRSKSVGTKVSEAELRVLESRAERAGLTLSESVRDVLLGSSVEMGTRQRSGRSLPRSWRCGRPAAVVWRDANGSSVADRPTFFPKKISFDVRMGDVRTSWE